MTGSRQRGWLYAAIVVNLLLWMAMLGSLYPTGAADKRFLTGLAATGFIFAALGQHWAYYALWKAQRDSPPVP